LLEAVEKHLVAEGGTVEVRKALDVPVKDLRLGDVLITPIETKNGKRILAPGYELSNALLVKLSGLATIRELKEPVRVRRLIS
ncbi:MAG: hypothetical protein ACPGNT_00965, partial [Rhodospirillales bacterium]